MTPSREGRLKRGTHPLRETSTASGAAAAPNPLTTLGQHTGLPRQRTLPKLLQWNALPQKRRRGQLAELSILLEEQRTLATILYGGERTPGSEMVRLSAVRPTCRGRCSELASPLGMQVSSPWEYKTWGQWTMYHAR